MNADVAALHASMMKVILGYTCVGVFIATAIITLMAMVGMVKLAEKKFLNRLFYSLVVEVVLTGTAVFSGLLSVRSSEPKQEAQKALNKVEERSIGNTLKGANDLRVRAGGTALSPGSTPSNEAGFDQPGGRP